MRGKINLFFPKLLDEGGDFLIAVKKVAVTGVGILCLVFAIFNFAIPTYARELNHELKTTIEPFWTHTSGINANLSINNNGMATMQAMVLGNFGTSHVMATVSLDRINPNGTTTRIATFSNIRAEGSVLAWERDHYVARGHDYRMTITSTVFRNGTSETASVSSRVVRAN